MSTTGTAEHRHQAQPEVEKKFLPSRKEGSVELKVIEFVEAVVGEPDPPGG